VHKIIGDEKDGCIVLTKIKIADKGVNLERLGRHLGLFKDVGSKENPLTATREMSDLDMANRLAALIRLAQERKAIADGKS
jgi:hypothetical protein